MRPFHVVGTLTENRMTVVKAWLGGIDGSFEAPGAAASAPYPEPLRDLLRDHVSINSTAVIVMAKNGLRVRTIMCASLL
jgi:magnesium-transporting ATPase (P-type)